MPQKCYKLVLSYLTKKSETWSIIPAKNIRYHSTGAQLTYDYFEDSPFYHVVDLIKLESYSNGELIANAIWSHLCTMSYYFLRLL